MCIRQRQLSGFTLIELIVFIVIVSVGLAGVLASLNVSVKGSADPLRPKQALAIAEGLLEEILLKSYCDPDTIVTTSSPPTCGANTSESREAFDDIEDFDSIGGGATTIATDSVGNAWPTGYSPAVTVTSTNIHPTGEPVAALQITVSVSYGGSQVISLTGYRANY